MKPFNHPWNEQRHFSREDLGTIGKLFSEILQELPTQRGLP